MDGRRRRVAGRSGALPGGVGVARQPLELKSLVRIQAGQPTTFHKETRMKYTVIIEKGRESGYVAHVPSLKGCVSQGETREEALVNVKEAIEAYVEALVEDGLPVPTEVGREAVEVEISSP